MSSDVIENVVSQHAEDAAFLWLLRNSAVHAPNYSLADLAKLDGSLEDHLDGLRIAGEAGRTICLNTLMTGSAGEVFAAAILAFESRDEACIDAVLEAAEENPESARGLVSALGWLSIEQAEPYIDIFLTEESPSYRNIGLAACIAHGRDPGQVLTDVLNSDDMSLKARVLEAVGRLGRKDLLRYLQFNMSAEDDLCRFNAAWSAALLGEAGSAAVLKTFARPDWPWHEEALRVALRRMSSGAALNWQVELAENPETMRLSVIGAGVIGDPILIPWLMEKIKAPGLARVAGEALTMITGVEIVSEDLEGEWPEGFEAGPNEDPEDENVDMDPDENLPWPNPELIAVWWGNKKGRFKTGVRYFLGLPVNEENLQQFLRTGSQRQRHAAARELAILKPGQPLFEVRAPGFRQKTILGVT